MKATGERGGGAAQRHIQQRAATLCILLRHSTTLIVAAVNLAMPGSGLPSGSRWVLLGLAGWAAYRLATRSQRTSLAVTDAAVAVVACAALPWIADSPHFTNTISAPQAIACAAVATFAVRFAAPFSLLVTLLIACAYTCGAAAVVGWSQIAGIDTIYFFAVQWVTGASVRFMIWRTAAAVDRARAERVAAEVAEHVAEARRNYDREQLAVLHDTAAATLLLVGEGAAVAPARLAAQASRDLKLLNQRPWEHSSAPIDLVTVLRTALAHVMIPTVFTGEKQLHVDGKLAAAVTAAVREATNNVQRHAQANVIQVDVGPQRVTVTDDGVGFAQDTARRGHGTRESILGRMQRAGGYGAVHSSPSRGTVVELTWFAPVEDAASELLSDTEGFIRRIRLAYGLAIAGFAVIGLLTTLPCGLAHTGHRALQCGLAALTIVCAAAAFPVILRQTRRIGWTAGGLLAAIALLQPTLLSPQALTTEANWSLGKVGWCVVPLLLGWPVSRAAVVLCAYWLVPAAIALIRDPSAHLAAYLCFSLAGFLIAQLFTLSFSTIVRQAAHAARAANEAHLEVVTKERVAQALQDHYMSRYAEVIERVVPVLTALSRGDEVTPQLRRRARVEWCRLRMLFDHAHAPREPLLTEIRSLAEVAELRGVEVSIEVDDVLPVLNGADLYDFVLPIAQLLTATDRFARIVLTANEGQIVGSVVCDLRSESMTEEIQRCRNVTHFVCSAGRAWMTVNHGASQESTADLMLVDTA